MTASRTARRSEALRTRIVDTACELVAERGVEGLTIEGVADRADVAVQTVYNRVGGRHDLLIAVAEKALAADRIHMDAAYAAPGTPAQRIEAAAAAYIAFATENPHQFRLLADPPAEPGVRQRIRALVGEQNAKLAAALADGIADGTLRPGLDPTRTATVLWAMMNGLLAHHITASEDQRLDPDTLLAVALDILRHGIEQS
ncbi:TetR/AcrR family transcriptional regulator [Nocardia transvalensis]|uniref:TetR/AcrR family transcriptional regulator n=1 Tax=Nocardia transvalensis TaxID=37333 RepID=UPI001893D352|nr:TetR/AcrR family transcriptional regulator [Nocardia transvalensis]MBF6327111.1 TetR/AcrR family transcriptional regulator [Nocardia transvalensis]